LPTIYVLAGVEPDEACVIERLADRFHVIEGPASAVNAWQASDWPGRLRGQNNTERLELIRSAARSLDSEFEWLRPPILNRKTRLVLVADASSRSIVAQGYESGKAATAVLQATV
jgi:hypothetical protein